ncbi:MAG: hypothetical protein Q9223_001311 [Gallowayella weberi]
MSLGRGRHLVLTFDAFGTLFYPRQPIGQQYAETARTYGLSGLTDQDVEENFRKGYPFDILWTFADIQDSIGGTGRLFAPSIFFKGRLSFIGIISNSDDRIPAILASLGISVSDRRYGSGAVASTDHSDIGWVVMSYDVGIEKPDKGIFDAAKGLSTSFAESESEKLYIHVGDSIKEDYRGSLDAGWEGVLLDREGKHKDDIPEADRMTNLTSLTYRLMHSRCA